MVSTEGPKRYHQRPLSLEVSFQRFSTDIAGRRNYGNTPPVYDLHRHCRDRDPHSCGIGFLRAVIKPVGVHRCLPAASRPDPTPIKPTQDLARDLWVCTVWQPRRPELGLYKLGLVAAQHCRLLRAPDQYKWRHRPRLCLDNMELGPGQRNVEQGSRQRFQGRRHAHRP